MAWSVRFDGYNDPTGDASKQARFRFSRSGEAHTVVGVARSRTLDVELGMEEEAAEFATLRWAVRWIGQLVASKAMPADYTTELDAVVLTSSEADELRRLAGAKECRYQTRVSSDSDLYCAAAAKSDDTAVRVTGCVSSPQRASRCARAATCPRRMSFARISRTRGSSGLLS